MRRPPRCVNNRRCVCGARTGPSDVQQEGPLPAVTLPSSLTSLPAPRVRDVYVRVCAIAATATRVVVV